jgi:hypothetical protein
MSESVAISELISGGEELPGPIESEDFVEFEALPVGNYTSYSREITGKKRPDGHYTYTVSFTSGVVDSEGNTHAAGRFPLKTWISTTPMKDFDRNGKERGGYTSSVAKYLKACGFKAKNLTFTDINEHLQESQAIPVTVFVSRTDQAKKKADGTWESRNLKAKDFKTGETKDEETGKMVPVYANSVTIDGEVFLAKAKVSSFSRMKE